MRGWFDIAIVGGGPAGTATAIALARSGRSVVVLERSNYDDVRIGETLPPIVQLPLVDLKAWSQFVHEGHVQSSGTLSAWGQDQLYEEHFVFSPYGCGWHLDRQRFDAMLARFAEGSGASVCYGAQVISCLLIHSGSWQVEFTSGGKRNVLRAAFLVDATGRAATVARQQGAKRIRYDRLIGIVGLFSVRSPQGEHDDRTLVEAVEDGWWYSAWLPSSRLVVVYLTDSDLKPAGHVRLWTHWKNRLEQASHTRSRIGGCLLETGLNIVAANSYRMNHVTADNWLAVGDAATAYDPLSSRGIYNALESGLQAAYAIDQYVLGDRAALIKYEIWTQTRFNEYLSMRTLHYRREQRWPGSKFWQRRQQV